MGACQKGLGRRRHDKMTNKQSCDSIEGDWLRHCLGSNAPPQTQEIAEQHLPPPTSWKLPLLPVCHSSFLLRTYVCVSKYERVKE